MTKLKTPTKREVTLTDSETAGEYIEERKVAQLGLISIHERIPDDFVTWTQLVERDGGPPGMLKCDAMPQYGGVPHGFDNDVTANILRYFTEAGCPQDGLVMFSARDILERIGAHHNATYYQQLRTATFSATDVWRDHQRNRWVTVTFNYLADLEFSSESQQGLLADRSMITVRLAPVIVHSVRASYIKPLDFAFLASLDRRLTRALYRLLDARRFSQTDLGARLPEITVGLSEWAELCKLTVTRPDKVRRTLEPAHEELLAKGYLTSVEYAGRGAQQQIRYVFAGVAPSAAAEVAPAFTREDWAAVALLTARRVSKPKAQEVVQRGEALVRDRVRKFDALLAAGYTPRSKTGLLIDVIMDESGKYADPEGFVPLDRQQELERRRTLRPPAEAELRPAAEANLPLEERVKAAIRSAQMYVHRNFDARDWTELRQRMLDGRLNPEAFARELAQAAFKMNLQEKVDEIKALLA